MEEDISWNKLVLMAKLRARKQQDRFYMRLFSEVFREPKKLLIFKNYTRSCCWQVSKTYKMTTLVYLCAKHVSTLNLFSPSCLHELIIFRLQLQNFTNFGINCLCLLQNDCNVAKYMIFSLLNWK